jgi:hypothetical protein
MAIRVNPAGYFGFRRTHGDDSENDGLFVGVPALLLPTDKRHLHFASAGDEDTDWAISNPTNPRFFVHSETTPASNYGYLEHDATDFNIVAGAGSVMIPSAALGIADNISLELGSDDDSVLRHKSAATTWATAITDVTLGTPVGTDLAANSLIISNVTASGDIAIAVNNGGNSEQAVFIDASAKLLTLGQTGWSLQAPNGAVKLTLGTAGTFATTQPTNALVIKTGTAPVGAITTSVGLFTDGTSMKKIIADGTASNVET